MKGFFIKILNKVKSKMELIIRIFCIGKLYIQSKHRKKDNNFRNRSSENKYLAVGFDDFRTSDFQWTLPYLLKYNFTGTFNYIFPEYPSLLDKICIRMLISYDMEIGNHTILHVKFPYYSPLFNGQNPSCLDGQQLPFPSNNDLRSDRGDGRNVFGKLINSEVSFQSSLSFPHTSWKNLTDEECQKIREYFSVFRNKKIGSLLDKLSNVFLGTTGSSDGSWNGTCYTKGIFSGCKTSENHEVWERIIQIQELYYRKYFPNLPRIVTWSMPGSENANLYFERDNIYYYDREFNKPANDLSKFPSSLILEKTYSMRSWTDVLRKYGYIIKHDSAFQGREDGLVSTEEKHWPVNNIRYSKKDILNYPTERSVCYRWKTACKHYTKFYLKNSKRKIKLYNCRDYLFDEFYISIEIIRRDVARGLICGSVWDTSNEYGEKIFWKYLLDYCDFSGIKVVSEYDAYRISCGDYKESENYIRNVEFVNTAENYFKGANVPSNPDGYEGDCFVTTEYNNKRVLNISGKAIYKIYGIAPYKYEYSFMASGVGNVYITLIKATDADNINKSEMTAIVISTKIFHKYEKEILVPPDSDYYGIKFCYVGNYQIKDIVLKKL